MKPFSVLAIFEVIVKFSIYFFVKNQNGSDSERKRIDKA